MITLGFRSVTYLLVAALISPALSAQTNPSPAPPQAGPLVPGLKILVLEGQSAINNLELGSATMPVIEVRDQNDRPVERAEVVFRLPATGAGGFFPKQAVTAKFITNVQGQAAATGFLPNHETGRFTIHVTAQFGNQIGEGVITQTNVASSRERVGPRKWGWKKWPLILGIAGGVTAGIVLGTRGGSSQPTNTVIGITPGPVTIGGGR